MAELRPQPLADLMRRMVVEWSRHRAIFDLPERNCWRGSERDLSVEFHGKRAATAAGPAAGPQSQLAQNVVLAWLAGARILELKTVQIQDQLTIPRPCIDATNVGYNIEWSQELRLGESLEEYAKAHLLVEALKRWNPLGLAHAQMDTLLDVSVGYSLEGIRSEPMARWLDALRNAGPILDRLRSELPSELRSLVDHEIPTEIYDCVTLSTFHGCPADEIERIVGHLFERHQLHVIVKMNPTLLGYDTVSNIVHDELGYGDVRVHRPAFAADLQWDDALAMMQRLERCAARVGRTLGAKFTNTLVVENHKSFFPAAEKLMYLSGAPLHVLAIELASRFTQATAARYPLSFSAGIDRHNFADVVACGIVPVTTCTDLLRPGGYGRLPKYLDQLEAMLEAAQVETVADLCAQRGGRAHALTDYAARVRVDPRYAAGKNSGIPRRIGRDLALFDCINCDKCVPVCPNDANFTLETPHVGPFETFDLVVEPDGTVSHRAAGTFSLSGMHQIANLADFCNDCGNCDVFCPETGGPYKVKPRFFGSLDGFRASSLDGFHVADRVIHGRIEGVEYLLAIGPQHHEFADRHVAAQVDPHSGQVMRAQAHPGAPAGHTLRLWCCHAMRALYEGVLAGVNPVSAARLAVEPAMLTAAGTSSPPTPRRRGKPAAARS
jgi:putative selenate reductase